MARLARVVIPNWPHHVIQRGNRRQRVFFCDKDKMEYLNLLAKYTQQEGIELWAYCLMDNHVHFIALPPTQESLARGIGEAHRMYTRHINFRERWRGYLWQGRFSSFPLDEPHLYSAIRYIERNPVRAGIVKKAEEYRWSSARAHVYSLDDPLLSSTTKPNIAPGDWSVYLSGPDSEETLQQIRQHAKTGRPLGDEVFIDELEALTGRVLRPQKRGPKGKN